MSGDMTNGDRQGFGAFSIILDVVLNKLSSSTPRLVGILEILKIRQRPVQFFRQHTVELCKTTLVLSSPSLSTSSDTRGEFTTFCRLIFIWIYTGVVNEHH